MKMSAKFATCSRVSLARADIETDKAQTYLQVLLGFQDLCQCFAGLNTKCVAQKPHFLHIVVLLQRLDMRLDVLCSGELQTFALKGENFVSRHVGLYKRKKRIVRMRLRQWYQEAGSSATQVDCLGECFGAAWWGICMAKWAIIAGSLQSQGHG